MKSIIVKNGMSIDEVNILNKEHLSELGLCILKVRPLKKCADCNTGKFTGYMLKHEVWQNELKLMHNIVLCFRCMLNRLKRPITEDDFMDTPINEVVINTLRWNSLFNEETI